MKMPSLPRSLACLLAAASLWLPLSVRAGDVEVLHWWTAPGEQRAVATLRGAVTRQGHVWHDAVVSGGGGQESMSVLRMRTLNHNPPSAALLKGGDIQEWGRLGLLADLDGMAAPEHWDALLPAVVAQGMKYGGHYVAVPLGMHRTNWLWINPVVFAQAGAKPPATLDELFAAAEKLKAAGFTPIAHGSQTWQDGILFENLALSILGPRGYRRVFVELDGEALAGPGVAAVFAALKKLHGYIAPDTPARVWNEATADLIAGKAGMQIMGDWAKGEWTVAGKKAGRDYQCLPFPGTSGGFLYSLDALAMFKLAKASDRKAQRDLAHIALTPGIQIAFNREKGSIPVRTDVSPEPFDACAQRAMRDLQQAQAAGNLLPGLNRTATSGYVLAALFEVIAAFLRDPDADPANAARQLAAEVRAAR